ncbi:hypothetical protein DPSP01_012614 [Paraphaeosphaeria sporulosa]
MVHLQRLDETYRAHTREVQKDGKRLSIKDAPAPPVVPDLTGELSSLQPRQRLDESCQRQSQLLRTHKVWVSAEDMSGDDGSGVIETRGWEDDVNGNYMVIAKEEDEDTVRRQQSILPFRLRGPAGGESDGHKSDSDADGESRASRESDADAASHPDPDSRAEDHARSNVAASLAARSSDDVLASLATPRVVDAEHTLDREETQKKARLRMAWVSLDRASGFPMVMVRFADASDGTDVVIDPRGIVCQFRVPLDRGERPNVHCWGYCINMTVVDGSTDLGDGSAAQGKTKGRGDGRGKANPMALPVGSQLMMAGPRRTMRDWCHALTVLAVMVGETREGVEGAAEGVGGDVEDGGKGHIGDGVADAYEERQRYAYVEDEDEDVGDEEEDVFNRPVM